MNNDVTMSIADYNALMEELIEYKIIIRTLLDECYLSNNDKDLMNYGTPETLYLIKELFKYKYLNKVEELKNEEKIS